MPNGSESGETPHAPDQKPDLTQEGIPIVSQETYTALLGELARLTSLDQGKSEDRPSSFEERILSKVETIRRENPKVAEYIETILAFHNQNPEAARATLGAQLVILYELLTKQAEANTLKGQMGKI